MPALADRQMRHWWPCKIVWEIELAYPRDKGGTQLSSSSTFRTQERESLSYWKVIVLQYKRDLERLLRRKGVFFKEQRAHTAVMVISRQMGVCIKTFSAALFVITNWKFPR